MYRSLYQVIKPKVDAKKSGVIKLLHANGQTGEILLEDGILTKIIQGKTYGVDAADIIFRWVSMAVIFMEGESLDLPWQKVPDTSAALDQLKEIDEQVAIFKELIGGCDAVFKFVGRQAAGAQNFTAKELNISFLLDGNSTIKSVVQKSELSELDVLSTVCKLLETDLLNAIHSHQPMAEDKRSSFLDHLENILSDITGPVASVIINDAFDAIGGPPEALAQCDIPFLFSVIAFQLEDDEKEAFSSCFSSIHPKI